MQRRIRSYVKRTSVSGKSKINSVNILLLVGYSRCSRLSSLWQRQKGYLWGVARTRLVSDVGARR